VVELSPISNRIDLDGRGSGTCSPERAPFLLQKRLDTLLAKRKVNDGLSGHGNLLSHKSHRNRT